MGAVHKRGFIAEEKYELVPTGQVKNMNAPIIGLSVLIHLTIIMLAKFTRWVANISHRLLLTKAFSLAIIVTVSGALFLGGLLILSKGFDEYNNFNYASAFVKNVASDIAKETGAKDSTKIDYPLSIPPVRLDASINSLPDNKIKISDQKISSYNN